MAPVDPVVTDTPVSVKHELTVNPNCQSNLSCTYGIIAVTGVIDSQFI